jgi:hypothetical protein
MHELLELQNFNAFVALDSALNHTAIFRLHKTKSVCSNLDITLYFQMLSPSKLSILENYQKLFDPHWKELSDRVRKSSPPCIPFIGAFLSQLVFINNAPTILNNMVSFRKCKKIACVIREIQRFQTHPYPFKVDTAIIVSIFTHKIYLFLEISSFNRPTKQF